MIEGSLENFRQYGQMEKQKQEVSEKRKVNQRRERVRRKKMQVRKKVKSRETLCFPLFCDSGESKNRLAKAADAEPSGEMRDEKLHAVVVRSTCGSQTVKHTSVSECIWKFRCRKGACGWREAHFEVEGNLFLFFFLLGSWWLLRFPVWLLASVAPSAPVSLVAPGGFVASWLFGFFGS